MVRRQLLPGCRRRGDHPVRRQRKPRERRRLDGVPRHRRRARWRRQPQGRALRPHHQLQAAGVMWIGSQFLWTPLDSPSPLWRRPFPTGTLVVLMCATKAQRTDEVLGWGARAALLRKNAAGLTRVVSVCVPRAARKRG